MPNDAIGQINALSEEAFVARFGGLFEHSRWVAENVLPRRPFADVDAMIVGMTEVVSRAGGLRQMDLLRAHPKLADKAAMAAGLTDASAAEQASAGLDRLTAEEFARFHTLNAAYDEKFGFPFIICVRLAGGKAGILAAMEARLNNSLEGERRTALAEVSQIARLRFQDMISEGAKP